MIPFQRSPVALRNSAAIASGKFLKLVIAVILDNFESYRYVLRVSHIMTHCLPILVPEGTITSAHTRLPNCLLIHITRD